MAPRTIALGPGFIAGEDVDLVIETKRGHNLGRMIRAGAAAPNSGVPGMIGGYAKERVIHAAAEGILQNIHAIGDLVEQGETIAVIRQGTAEIPVLATITGIIRGLIRDGYPVTEGFKIADIDPRKEELQNCFTISDKARCIAGGVLEAVCEAGVPRRSNC
jgi:xanthine dehydrogenase accessory factor